MHRWDKKGSGRGPAALETAPPSRESSRPHLSNHSPAHLHPQVAASRANSPTSYPAARTLVTHWAYCLEPPAPKKGTEGRQKEREVRIKNGRGRPSQRQFGKTSVPSSTPLPNQLTKADPPARRGCSRSRPAPSGGRPGSGARRQRERGGNGRVGWAWLARGRARNKAARLPLPGAGASPGRAARAERAALLRDNGPLPRRRAPGTKARSGAGRPAARPPLRPLAGPQSQAEAGEGTAAAVEGCGQSPRREHRQPPRRLPRHKEERDPRAAPRHPGAPAADGARRPALLLLLLLAPHSPTAPCPSSWRNVRRLAPAGLLPLSARADFPPPRARPASLCLERCRHHRAPQ